MPTYRVQIVKELLVGGHGFPRFPVRQGHLAILPNPQTGLVYVKQGCIKFLISFGEEYKVGTRGRGYHCCGEEYYVEKMEEGKISSEEDWKGRKCWGRKSRFFK